MRHPNRYLTAAFVVAGSVLLIIPLWAIFGVLLPEEGAGHAHGGGDMVMAADFEDEVDEFIEHHGLPDGSVQGDHDEPVLILARQYAFKPSVIRLSTGEDYQLQLLSEDVVHAISIQMGDTSFNTTIMPETVTAVDLLPTQPGTYLVLCNEYCGIGHDFMYFTIIVEGEGGQPHDDEHAEDDHHDGDEHAEDEEPHQ